MSMMLCRLSERASERARDGRGDNGSERGRKEEERREGGGLDRKPSGEREGERESGRPTLDLKDTFHIFIPFTTLLLLLPSKKRDWCERHLSPNHPLSAVVLHLLQEEPQTMLCSAPYLALLPLFFTRVTARGGGRRRRFDGWIDSGRRRGKEVGDVARMTSAPPHSSGPHPK